MRTHVQRTASRCFAVIRQLRQIRRSVQTDTFKTLVGSLVLTRLDYGNCGVLAGLPVFLTRRLQSVLNAAVRLTYYLCRSDHITDACLPPLRVHAGASPVVDRRFGLQGLARTCFTIHWSIQLYFADLPGRQSFRSAGTIRLAVHPVKLTWHLG